MFRRIELVSFSLFLLMASTQASAEAGHTPQHTLNVAPETVTREVGGSHTLTATVFGLDGSASGAVDFEFTGANDPDSGDTPGTPDQTCTVSPGSDPTQGTCDLQYSGTNAGTTTIMAWIDDDNDNSTVEADQAEGVNEGSNPGAEAEPDGTDVVSGRWQPERCPGFEDVPGEHVIGTAGRNLLTGSASKDVLCGLGGRDRIIGRGNKDILIGGKGRDILDGRGGADRLLGGPGRDTVTYAKAASKVGTGIGAYLAEGIIQGWGLDRVSSIYKVIGSAVRDVLSGDRGPNSLVGGGGPDELSGGAGPDKLDGSSGRDSLRPGEGKDIVIGARGSDIITYTRASRRIRVNLARHAASGEGHDRIREVESVRGSRFSDSLQGSDKGNRLQGGAGSDQLKGLGGRDRLSGGPGRDKILGQSGDDNLSGGSGRDRLMGGAGNDSLRGHSGKDTCHQNEGTGMKRSCELPKAQSPPPPSPSRV